MTLWVDRSAETAGAQGRTHALVVGVSRYANLPAKGGPASADEFKMGLKQAETPVAGAFAFAKWLRDVMVNPAAPLSTLRLLLSPSQLELQADADLANAAPTVEAATTPNVRKALLEWWTECRGDPKGIAVVYMSGHGVQLSKTDSYVLLEDFGADPSALDYSVDVGGVFRSMGGATMPQTQLYFIDACRIQPDLFARYRTAGKGIAPPEPLIGPDDRAAPVYFSASPDRPALGQPGKGTLFAQALEDALAASGSEGSPDDQDRWYISTYSLAQALGDRVEELAQDIGEVQYVVVGGQVRDAPIHFFPGPPDVPVTIELDPETAAAIARFDLWQGDRQRAVLQASAFNPYPAVCTIPAGSYSIDVTINPPTDPYVSRQGVAVPAYPHLRARTKVKVVP